MHEHWCSPAALNASAWHAGSRELERRAAEPMTTGRAPTGCPSGLSARVAVWPPVSAVGAASNRGHPCAPGTETGFTLGTGPVQPALGRTVVLQRGLGVTRRVQSKCDVDCDATGELKPGQSEAKRVSARAGGATPS